MFKVIEAAGKNESVIGQYATRAAAEQVCDEMVAGAGKAGLMIGYFIQETGR